MPLKGAGEPIRTEQKISWSVPCRRREITYINYFNYYAADKFKDNSGDTVDGFDLKVAADVFRFIHVTDKQFLGGSWAMHAFIPLVYMDVKLDPSFTGAPFKMEDSRGSLGDIIVDPFILGWHGANWHAVTGVDIYLPTGNYDKHRLANVGRNYWTFEPMVAATFLPGAGFDISAKLMYDINTENNAYRLQVRPGISCRFCCRQEDGRFYRRSGRILLPADD